MPKVEKIPTPGAFYLIGQGINPKPVKKVPLYPIQKPGELIKEASNIPNLDTDPDRVVVELIDAVNNELDQIIDPERSIEVRNSLGNWNNLDLTHTREFVAAHLNAIVMRNMMRDASRALRQVGINVFQALKLPPTNDISLSPYNWLLGIASQELVGYGDGTAYHINWVHWGSTNPKGQEEVNVAHLLLRQKRQ